MADDSAGSSFASISDLAGKWNCFAACYIQAATSDTLHLDAAVSQHEVHKTIDSDTLL